ncbi:hypothetical protein PsorP6_011419 [Peronosclerospora sorghi]|uniref:Uncharacterized protein n=1 Tax=Peronosclerospora sorghi TaxID=230839 RepID=A0ACC0WMP0_9STRA|nr:hypothetical protein PsorP6_011419 [Peronosclerospora sorghi]
MLRTWAFAACYVAIHGSSASAGTFDQYDAKAEAIVQSFSPEQLLGQMTQLDLGMIMNSDTRELNETAVRTYAKMYVGSYLNTYFSEPVNGTYGFSPRAFRAMIQRIQEISMEENGGHPIIYGIDSVHGANYVDGSVLFPQQINSAASFNPQLLFDAARVTARDTEAAGISWIFAPILDISQHKLWARTFETFGEDTYLATVMADAIVRGLQSRNQTAACLKHFIAYSKEPTGHDRENVLVSDFDILNTFMPPYKAAMEAGALSVMENYISINGDPVIRSSKLLNGLLRNDLQFDGVLLTDWAEIYNLHDWHRVSASRKEAVATSLMQTSVDVSMVPTDTDFIQYGLTMLEQHPEQLERLRQSVKRVIKLKLGLGLYEKPVPGNEYVTLTGNKQDVATALDMARESIVLVQNNNATLPLPKQASVFLTGPKEMAGMETEPFVMDFSSKSQNRNRGNYRCSKKREG